MSKKNRRKPAAGRFFVIRALDRKVHSLSGAIALAKSRIARPAPGHSHTLLVVRTAAVVRLKRVMVIAVEKAAHVNL